jgi:hypothetical protein
MKEESDQKQERDKNNPKDNPKCARYSKEVDMDILETVAAYDGKPGRVAEQIARKWGLRITQVNSRISNIKNNKEVKTFKTFVSGNPIDYWEKIDNAKKPPIPWSVIIQANKEAGMIKESLSKKTKDPYVFIDVECLVKELLQADFENYSNGSTIQLQPNLRKELSIFIKLNNN